METLAVSSLVLSMNSSLIVETLSYVTKRSNTIPLMWKVVDFMQCMYTLYIASRVIYCLITT